MKRICFLFFLLPVSLYSQVAYYRADKSGAVFNQIGVSRLDEFKYVLSVEELDNAIIRRLFENQKEIRRWERTYENRKSSPGYYQESEFVGDKKLLTSYFVRFRLDKEEIYFENKLSEIRVYQYSGDGLSSTTVKSSDENTLYTTTYTRGSHGRLLRATNSHTSGETTYSVYGFREFDLRNQIHTYSGYSFQYNYFKGKLVSTEEWQGDNLVYRKIERNENYESIEEDFLNEKTVVRTFDKDERIIKEVTQIGSAKIIVDYLYDAENRVSQKFISSDARRERVTYTYGAEDQVTESLIYVNDQLTRKLIYEDSLQDYTEIVYRQGKPFMRILFRDNIEVENELLFHRHSELDGEEITEEEDSSTELEESDEETQPSNEPSEVVE